ncbi:lanthionine synthetase LanC family protein, partial [Kibdelosporangium lantanae]
RRQAEHGSWICGVAGGVEHPGLMTGLAGIGLALLRMVDPSVPSVLLLEGVSSPPGVALAGD